jgi:hypothetical protein
LNDLCATLQVEFPFADGYVFPPEGTLLLLFGTLERVWESQIQAAIPSLEATSDPDSFQPTHPPVVLTEPVLVRFLAVHRETGENLGVEVPGGELMALELSVRQLPLAGLYDWTVSIFVGSLGEQCMHRGTFVVADATEEP